MQALLHPRITPRQWCTVLLPSSPFCTFSGARGAVQGCRASAGTRVSLRVCTSSQARMQEGLGVVAEGSGRLSVPASIWLVRTGSDDHSHPICWRYRAPSAAPLRPTVTLAEGSGSVQGGAGGSAAPARAAVSSQRPENRAVADGCHLKANQPLPEPGQPSPKVLSPHPACPLHLSPSHPRALVGVGGKAGADLLIGVSSSPCGRGVKPASPLSPRCLR